MPRFRPLSAAAVLALAACSSVPKPYILDDDRRTEYVSDQEAERRAREQIADIERRVASGDLPKIQFQFDSDEITPDSYETLDLIASVITANSKLKVFVLAHCDSVGTEEYNLDLSQRRAKSVKTYLVKRGLYPPFIRYHGFGFSRPLADNATEEGRAKNRRVEFRITTRDWSSVY
jgi:outer membrane protein OmpA-like peptidoglycan-associated protein